MIPNNILQFWDDFKTLPPILQESMTITKEHNKKHTFIIADDNFIKTLITKTYSPAIENLYSQIKIPACKSDLARLFLLYEYGGYYIDVSMELQSPISNLVSPETELLLVKRDDIPIYNENPSNAHVINGIIASPQGSSFIFWCIQRVLRNLTNDDLNKIVHVATGPIVINQALLKFKKRINIKFLSFNTLLKDSLNYRRADGISNSWTRTQQFGILEPEYFNKHSMQYEKTWTFKSRLFHISLRTILFK